MPKRIYQKVVYGQNQKDAMETFRKTTSSKYTPIKAKYAGTKHGAKVYLVKYRLKKHEY